MAGVAKLGFDHVGEVTKIDNPKPQKESAPGLAEAGTNGDRVVVVLVGLPATDKTYISRRLKQYLRFFPGADAESFNVGHYRRTLLGAKTDTDYFDPDNSNGVEKREELAQIAMDDLKLFLQRNEDEGHEPARTQAAGRVAIFDATNSTRARRAWVFEQVRPLVESRRNIIFVESVCSNTEARQRKVEAACVNMPDYEDVDTEDAISDLNERIANYSRVYEPLGEAEDMQLSWIRMVDEGRSISMNHISGYLQGRIMQFLMNLHTTPRQIYLSRHGESEYNHLSKIGGDSSLSPRGEVYALKLAEFVHETVLGLNPDGSFRSDGGANDESECNGSIDVVNNFRKNEEELGGEEEEEEEESDDDASAGDTSTFGDQKVSTCGGSANVVPHVRLFTSSLRRTRETARHIAHPVCDDGWVCMRPRVWRALDEIYAGVFDGLTYETIKEIAPKEYEARSNNKLAYRYPRGESYLDVVQRLEPVVHEVERHRDSLVVVGHQGILRIIYAYLMGMDREAAPHVSIPLNTVIRLSPGTYSCEEERIRLVVDGLNDEPPSH